MDAIHFDRISKALSQRRLSRRSAVSLGGAGLAAGALTVAGVAGPSAAQEATPDATPAAGEFDPSKKVDYLFVQSFEAGSLAPKPDTDGVFTVTLAHGLGQTLYFSDRPARDVGAGPTAQFLESLGFSPSDPPNAAFVVETAPGETSIAVVELTSAVYDPTTRGVTYEVKPLADWQDSVEMGFRQEPLDLANIAASFGAAHLFIDSCADSNLSCCPKANINCDDGPAGPGCHCTNLAHDFGTVNYCAQYGRCVPCLPYYHDAPSYEATWNYWDALCNGDFPACGGDCESNYWLD